MAPSKVGSAAPITSSHRQNVDFIICGGYACTSHNRKNACSFLLDKTIEGVNSKAQSLIKTNNNHACNDSKDKKFIQDYQFMKGGLHQ
jgi:hypothetical protein